MVTGNLADFPDAIRAGVAVLAPAAYLDGLKRTERYSAASLEMASSSPSEARLAMRLELP